MPHTCRTLTATAVLMLGVSVSMPDIAVAGGVPVFDAANKVSAIIAVIRDESTRFNEDRALKKRLAELG